ncbi:thiamine phosphate synthase [Mucilaginibacter ginsenosidivorax]|uniref:Thiamine phosphate synthase n=1 Tax=Mucilaginibacter ginsenosidivorax TaxID=862126 RepID=A0A5B8W1A9_9SPHI|nr:thiamine phosphate synthase [Mucilaginibacter ginsenosidivorax]QEC76662.1 thiamine phosphate synthase [Mucilaginibacter ginsenosidivorax]
MKKYISRFHYITQDMPQRSHIQQVEIACNAGANWIQYRCNTKPENELIAEIDQIAAICDDWGATLIITNHYQLLDKVDAQGVHIEDEAADFSAIREAINDDKTLGASATNLAGLLKTQDSGIVDYCVLGPFAHTETRPNNFPLLGYDGYRQLEKAPVEIPVIATGGIQLQDVELLLKTGIYGIAVSSAINRSVDPGGMVKEFYRKVY